MSKNKNKREKPEKMKIIKETQKNEKDTGSAEVQIGLLTKEIKNLTEHLNFHIHDFSSRRGLLKKVGQRRNLLKYLRVNNPKSYEKMVKRIKA